MRAQGVLSKELASVFPDLRARCYTGRSGNGDAGFHATRGQGTKSRSPRGGREGLVPELLPAPDRTRRGQPSAGLQPGDLRGHLQCHRHALLQRERRPEDVVRDAARRKPFRPPAPVHRAGQPEGGPVGQFEGVLQRPVLYPAASGGLPSGRGQQHHPRELDRQLFAHQWRWRGEVQFQHLQPRIAVGVPGGGIALNHTARYEEPLLVHLPRRHQWGPSERKHGR